MILHSDHKLLVSTSSGTQLGDLGWKGLRNGRVTGVTECGVSKKM